MKYAHTNATPQEQLKLCMKYKYNRNIHCLTEFQISLLLYNHMHKPHSLWVVDCAVFPLVA